jgi:hypothetical protein
MMKLDKLNLRLSKQTLNEYPKAFEQKYKKYEFMECYAYSIVDNKSFNLSGRFQGIIKDKYGDYLHVYLFDTLCKELFYHLNVGMFIDNRIKFEVRGLRLKTNRLPQNVISKIKINLYPFYVEQLMLIYWNLLKQNMRTTSDCFYAISQFLKPTNKDQYDTIYSFE